MRGPPTLHPLTRGCPLNHNSPPPSDCKWAQVPQEQGVRFHQILPYNVEPTYEEVWFHQIVPCIPGGSVPQTWFHQIIPYNVWLTYEEVWFHQIVPYIPGGALTQMWFHQNKPYIFTLSTDLIIIMMHVLIIYLNEHGTFGHIALWYFHPLIWSAWLAKLWPGLQNIWPILQNIWPILQNTGLQCLKICSHQTVVNHSL